MLTAEETAIAIVEGVLENRSEISIPKYHNTLVRLFHVLPEMMQNFIRDCILNESKKFVVKDFDKI
jgi:hypothetical protein